MTLLEINREYNDGLFKFIFGNPKNKEWTLKLYNALNESNYNNPDDINYYIINDAIHMNVKNDNLYLIANDMSLWNPEYKYSPYLQVEFFSYLAKFYEDYARRRNMELYELKEIPKVFCICLYDVKDKDEDRSSIDISELFENNRREKSSLKFVLPMININYGHNKDILKKCKPLQEYSFFVDKLRFYIEKFENEGKDYMVEDVIDAAISDVPKDFEIFNFLLDNKKQISDICSIEYGYKKEYEAGKYQ